MKNLIDARPKKNQAIRDSFLAVPDVLTPRQVKAIEDLRRLLRFDLTEKDHA